MLCIVVLCAGVVAGCANKADNASTTDTAQTADTTEPAADGAAESSIPVTQVFVPAEWVKSVVDGNEAQSQTAVIVEASWGEAGDDYKKAHIPGALHLNTDLIEEDKYWNIRTGDEIAQVMADFGITKTTPVIVYGSDSGADRFAFVCLWAGVDEVHVLDGGYAAWTAAGYPTSDAAETANAAPDFGATIPAHPEYVLAMPAEVIAAQADPNFRLVSIRSWDEFIGKTSGYDYIKRAGEPKGAVWGHDEADYYDSDGLVKSLDSIVTDYWEEWDVGPDNDIAFYCGTGWRATVPWLLCYQNGWKNIKLYDGGWFVWQMDSENPVQTGDPRS
jgi:thiosulfate/3-mercaptopyruvate sulfurtransferase